MAALVSENGLGGKVSSFGSTMETWSGRGLFGPILPLGSQGSIILTCNRKQVTPVKITAKILVHLTQVVECMNLIEVTIMTRLTTTPRNNLLYF